MESKYPIITVKKFLELKQNNKIRCFYPTSGNNYYIEFKNGDEYYIKSEKYREYIRKQYEK